MDGARTGAVLLPLIVWTLASSAAGAVIGVAVGFFGDGIEAPTVIISVLFGNVVGLSVLFSSLVLFPRLQGLAPPLRVLLLGLTLLSGSVAGSIAVLASFTLFVARDPLQAAAIVLLNGVLALIVGSVVFVYEALHRRLEETLREVEEVRLVEAQLREEAARAQLAALQARINPHFFFNTLNTIASLLEEEPDRAEEVVHRLADLFRYTFKVSDTGPVTLREELEFTRNYLGVEQARFGERLRVDWDLDPDSLEVRVPGLVLQPLVENAVGHGLAPRADGGTLRITSRLVDDLLHLDVADDGAGLSRAAAELFHDGHGLGNVRRRLQAFYDGRGSIALLPNPAGCGVVARLLIPATGRDAGTEEEK